MTNFKSYFRYHLKANLKPLLFILAVVVTMTFVIGINSQPRWQYVDALDKAIVVDYYSTLFLPVTFLCILVYVFPVMEFSFFKKRLHLDCAYSLPISRKNMGTVHYLTGLIALLGTFTASYLTNLFLMWSRGPGWFDYLPMIPHYFLCLLLGVIMYSFMVFIFNEANSTSDGIWFMLLYTFVFYLVVATLCDITNARFDSSSAYALIPWGVIDNMTATYQRLVELDVIDTSLIFWKNHAFQSGLLSWLLLGIGTAIGFFLTFGKRRTEKTEEISDSWFGYRTLIPLYAVCLMIVWHSSFIFWIILEVFTLIGYTIYRRGFHYKKSDLIILALLAIFLLV